MQNLWSSAPFKKQTSCLGLVTKEMKAVSIKQIVSFTIELETKEVFFNIIKQDKTLGNSWRKRTKQDGKIDFRMSTNAIINLVKALSLPYVGAHIASYNFMLN